MGWDAWAVRDGEPLRIASQNAPDCWSIEDLPLRASFELAAKRVRDKTGGAPSYLEDARLSGFDERMAFEILFGIRFDDMSGGMLIWPAAELRERAARVGWVIPSETPQAQVYWTVREFVKACIEHELGVQFNY
jgi:hypothetical protein